eukprot:808304-Pelagomonas_calceolata.AAC.2
MDWQRNKRNKPSHEALVSSKGPVSVTKCLKSVIIVQALTLATQNSITPTWSDGLKPSQMKAQHSLKPNPNAHNHTPTLQGSIMEHHLYRGMSMSIHLHSEAEPATEGSDP